MEDAIIAAMSERIGIAPGFYIQFSDGRAISRGREEADALPEVLFWLRTHSGHKNYELVEQWVELKRKQIQEDTQRAVVEIKREYVIDKVNDLIRRTKVLRDDKELSATIRAEVLKLHGLE